MAYKVYIFDDNNNTAELDTESIDFKTIFSVADVKDLGIRKDNVKQVQFKGTKNNNYVFGSYFDMAKSSDLNLDQSLYFNYNPLKTVTALVYEDSELIFKGTLRLVKINVGKDGEIVYDTVITGSFIEFKTLIQDKYLTDIDFSDLTHQYNLTNIVNSWTDEVLFVYPNIDYGYSATTDVNQIHLYNWKPAVYVNQYLTRIFDQSGGYTYEIKGSDQFKRMFNSLVIPDNNEGAISQYLNYQVVFKKPYPVLVSQERPRKTNGIPEELCYLGDDEYNTFTQLVPINAKYTLGDDDIDLIKVTDAYYDMLVCQRRFTTTGKLAIQFAELRNVLTGGDLKVGIKIQVVVKRNYAGNSPLYGWNKIIGEKELTLWPNDNITDRIIVEVGRNDFEIGDNIAVRLIVYNKFKILTNQVLIKYLVGTCELYFPAVITDQTTYTPYGSLSGGTGDLVSIKPPQNIKQTDFIKSIINLFNFYVYTKKENQKHFIFETYDDYYALASIQYLKDNAIDWTNKVDYSKGFEIKTNIELPKSYLFTYKEDSDFLNETYQTRYKKVYGSLDFTDRYGLSEQRKLELIFSPTVIVNESGTDRIYPCMYKVESNNKKVSKTNIRILSYNGFKECIPYRIFATNLVNDVAQQISYTAVTYPQVSNYYIEDDVPVFNLHFGVEQESYWPATEQYLSTPTAYQSWFINQVTELTNPNVVFVDCNVYLTEVDIANIDLKTPVYIQTGNYNGAYWKVLNVEYYGSDSASKVLLQKIAV